MRIVRFNKSFLLLSASSFIASIISCQAMQEEKWDDDEGKPYVVVSSRRSLDQDTSAEVLFNSFLQRSSNVLEQIKQKQIQNLAQTVIDFAALDCHYLETSEDTNQKGYKKLLEEEYYPLLDKLILLDKGEIKQKDLFTFVLNLYLKNIKETSNIAKAARKEDENFSAVKGTFQFYAPGKDMNFFRDPKIVPTCEAFLSEDSIIKFWNPKFDKRVDNKALKKGKTKLTAELNKIKKGMCELQMRVLPYRTSIEEYLNTLLYQSWSLVSDKTQLSNKTKKVLNAFEYIWPVLKTGSRENPNYDPLITEYTFSKTGQLHNVFSIYEEGDEEVKGDNVVLKKDMMPSKKKKKKKKKVAESSLDVSQQLPATIIVVDAEIPEQQEKITLVESPKSPVVQLKKAEPVTNVRKYDPLIEEKKESAVQRKTNQSLFDAVRATKHIQYDQIVHLFKDLKGVKVRTKGSHETWEFKRNDGKTISFGFWFLHDKDQYGPWTKKYILSLEQKLQN